MSHEPPPASFVPSVALRRRVNAALDRFYDHVADIVRSEAEDSEAPACVTKIASLEIMAAFARSLGVSYDTSATEGLYRRYIRCVDRDQDHSETQT